MEWIWITRALAAAPAIGEQLTTPHVEVDEKAAAKYPFGYGENGEKKDLNGGWGEIRRRDGTIIKQ